MTPSASIWRRLYLFVLSLPEILANGIRFRVFFILPRWFRMPSSVRVAGRQIRLRNPHEEGVEADFISCFLRNTYGLGHRLGEVRTIVDVGANLGFFALAARDYYPDAAIHAYEPNPRIQPELRENTDGLNIQIFPEAIGSKDGYVSLIDTGPSDQARTRESQGPDGAIPRAGLQTAIDRIGGTVDLLKLDCEGAEWNILELSGCWNSVRNIRLEYHLVDGNTQSDAINALARAGYTIVYAPQPGEHNGMIWAARRAV
jgi:FkbM family methyltransferase